MNKLDRELQFLRHPKFGYLTADLPLVGNGMVVETKISEANANLSGDLRLKNFMSMEKKEGFVHLTLKNMLGKSENELMKEYSEVLHDILKKKK